MSVLIVTRHPALGAACLGGALALLSAPAQAKPPEAAETSEAPTPQVRLGALLGATLELQRWDLQPEPDGPDGPQRLSPQLGARLSWAPLRWGALDAEWSYLPHSRERSGWLHHAMSWRAGAHATLWPEARVVPFAQVGLGLYHTIEGDADADLRMDWGLGAHMPLSGQQRARVDLRHVITDGVGDRAVHNNLELLLSWEFTIWSAAPPVKPPPPDADGDGTLDAEDRCPKQAGPATTRGCPDGDGDGIADLDDRCPKAPGVAALAGCPDADGDGITDAEDRCPKQAGPVKDRGCPDADGDGIVDVDDKCPDKPEDRDGFEDGDGCPDPDNDGDGIPDAADKCPMEPELRNGFEDEDGCPEPDRDKDGIIDALDKCPDKPETYNGVDDADGCPDGKDTVVITPTEVRINERVYFETGKAVIQKKSHKLLDVVASALRQNPQITRVRVEGHTDDVGDAAQNLTLSQKRAEAVRDYLVSKGVEVARLKAKGYGGTQPVCKDIPTLLAATRKDARAIDACRATNRRVQFQVETINNRPLKPATPTTTTKTPSPAPATTPAPSTTSTP